MAPFAKRFLPRNKLPRYKVVLVYGRVPARNRLHCRRHTAAPVRGGCIIGAEVVRRLYAVRCVAVKAAALVAAWKAASSHPRPYRGKRTVTRPVKGGTIVMARVLVNRLTLIKIPEACPAVQYGVKVYILMAIPAEPGVVCGRAVFLHKEVSVRAAVAAGPGLRLNLAETRVGLMAVGAFRGLIFSS